MLAYTDKGAGYSGLTGFILDADTPGVTPGRKVGWLVRWLSCDGHVVVM